MADIPSGGGKAVCTIISKNYLAYARTFAETYREHNPGEEVYVLLTDRIDGCFDPGREKFRLVELKGIGIENLEDFLFKYNIMELNTAVKPFFMEYLFKTYGLEKLAYFDPDIMMLGPLDELWELLDDSAIVLTPHLTAPIEDNLSPNEAVFLIAGAYNLGFIAVRNTPDVMRFISWWKSRLRHSCYVDIKSGYFVDQKWIDLVPGIFEKVLILTDPAYNTAYWNLHSRTVEYAAGGCMINGRPARFFHFSGFSPENAEAVSKHQTRFTLGKREDLRPLFEKYSQYLFANGYRETKDWPYSYGCFDNGVKIPDIARKMYGFLPVAESERFGDPFKAEGDESFFNWLSQGVGMVDRPGVKRLWYEVYNSRIDARTSFPDIFGRDWAGFTQWCMTLIEKERQIDSAFMGRAELDASSEILELRARKAELEAKVADDRNIIAMKEAVIADLRSHVADREATINNLRDSLSWRVTGPLRWLSGRVKQGLMRSR